MNIKIEIDSKSVIDALNRLLAAGEDLNPILNALGARLESNVRRGFETSTDPYGRPWPALTSRTGKPLVKTGAQLLGSISYQIDGNSVEIGTNFPWAKTHQYGATIRPTPGKFWQTEHTSAGKRGPKTHTATQPAKLVFMIGERLVFASQVTVPQREMFPTEGLPPDWEADANDAIAEVLRASLKE